MICDVCFVDFGGIIDHHCLKFLFKSRDRHFDLISIDYYFAQKKLQSNRKQNLFQTFRI